MIVCKRVSFDAAHFLPNYDGKCRSMHGHHWTVELAVKGLTEVESGMVIDFTILGNFLHQIKDSLDHQLINDIIDNPTAENISLYIYNKLHETDLLSSGIKFAWVKVWETESSYVELS